MAQAPAGERKEIRDSVLILFTKDIKRYKCFPEVDNDTVRPILFNEVIDGIPGGHRVEICNKVLPLITEGMDVQDVCGLIRQQVEKAGLLQQ